MPRNKIILVNLPGSRQSAGNAKVFHGSLKTKRKRPKASEVDAISNVASIVEEQASEFVIRTPDVS
jgi:hypothetical protein